MTTMRSTHFQSIHPRTATMKQLLQAIVDDDKTIVESLLAEEPKLLLMNPLDLDIKQIKGNKVGKWFFAEYPFIMAQQGGLLNMTELIASYFPKVEGGDQTAKDQWFFPPSKKENERDQAEEKKYTEIKDYLAILMHTINKDMNVSVELSSPATEEQLSLFKKMILPSEPVFLDYYTIERLLLEARKIYNQNFAKLMRNQQNVYAVRVIGLLESVLSPELAKVQCTGIYNVVQEEKKITELAANCIFREKNLVFYSSSASSSKKSAELGRKVLCGMADGDVATTSPLGVSEHIEKLLETQSKQRMVAFNEVRSQVFGEKFILTAKNT